MAKPNTNNAPLASSRPTSSVSQLSASIGQQQQTYQLPLLSQHQTNSTSDDFANSLISELKTIKLEPSNNTFTSTSANNNDVWSKHSLWSPHSPAASIKTQYHSASSHTASKESLLWQPSNQTQSPPNNADASSASSTTSSSSSSASLWENPGSTMSLMHSSSDQSFASIWNQQQPTTPPQVQSPGSKLSTMWSDSTPNSAYLTTDGSQSSSSLLLFGGKQSPSNAAIIVPTGCDIWSQANKDSVSSLWTNQTSHQTAIVDGCITSKQQQHQISSASDGFQHTNNSKTTHKNANNHLSNSTAASSCLQLFSDEFQNYLNMIN